MITSQEIEGIVLDLLRQDPWQLVVPAKVYNELERRARCGGCVPNIVDIIVRVTENFHAQQASVPSNVDDVKAGLERLKRQGSTALREARLARSRAA